MKMTQQLATKTNRVLILQGIQGSGKSTYAKEFIEDERKAGRTWKRVNRDSLRDMLDFGYWDRMKTKNLIKQAEALIIQEALETGLNVVVDDLNLSQGTLKWLRRVIMEAEFDLGTKIEIETKLIDTPLEECIKRDSKRDKPVGKEVILRTYNKYLKDKDKIVQDISLIPIVICDVDGTVAINDGHRSFFDFIKVMDDKPRTDIIELVKNMFIGTSMEVVFLSGRDGSCYEDTVKWIRQHFGLGEAYQLKLFMRKAGDNRADYIIKRELWEEHIKDKFYVKYVVDDRLSVCRLWQSMGFTLLNVGPGYEF